MAASLRKAYPYIAPSFDVNHLVVGAGVIGLAIAERLVQQFPQKSTFVIERHGQFGQETSSRNSEVIHSGIYYPVGSLKSRLCLKGRDLLYKRVRADDTIGYRQTGKLILSTGPEQTDYLQKLLAKSKDIEKDTGGKLPLELISGDQARELEPDVGAKVEMALLSPLTGIVSSHELMDSMEKSVLDSEAGEMVYGTRVVRIDKEETSGGGKKGAPTASWVVQTVTEDGEGGESERSAVRADVIINAAGLSAHHVLNQILEPTERQKQYFTKGNYFSYGGPGVTSVQRLLYPCPDPSGALAGLGTHLTMSLAGDIRFGPDVEHLTPKMDEQTDEEADPDFWRKLLAVNEETLPTVIEEVQKYLPSVDPAGFAPDYTGIRPKIVPPGGKVAADFSITSPAPGFVDLRGIESPGLTSSLAIAEVVEGMVREIWGGGRGKGEKVSEVGQVDGWA